MSKRWSLNRHAKIILDTFLSRFLQVLVYEYELQRSNMYVDRIFFDALLIQTDKTADILSRQRFFNA